MKVITSGTDAFSQAIDLYADTVYRVAIQNTACAADAEDITQEVFLKLLQSAKSFRDQEHIKAWLIRVTINHCRNFARSRKHETLTAELPDTAAAQDTSVLDAVKALPENQRNAIYLHYYEGYTAREIADLLGSRQNTVLSWLRRGREALRETIGGIEDEQI